MFGFTKFTEPPEITSLKYEKATKPGMQADEWNAAVSNGRLAGGSGIDAVTPTGIQIYKLSDEYRIDEVPEGFSYFDTTDGKPYWKAKDPEDSTAYTWVDATGEPKE
jgi:hypothetical protein